MVFNWVDYASQDASLVDGWLDETAISMTCIDSGWDQYWNEVITDSVNYPGCKDFCKLVKLNDVPIAAVVFGHYRGTVTISEILLEPSHRSKGYGSRIIRELIENSDTWFVERTELFRAVILVSNVASRKAFHKAGFTVDLAPDGSVYECKFKIERHF